MKSPRFSIGDLMALTGLAALDCLAWRDGRHPELWGLRSFFLPTLNALVVATYALARSGRRPSSRRFLVGFVVVGWAFFLHSLYINRRSIRAALTPLELDVDILPDPDNPEWTVAAFGLLHLLPALLAAVMCSAFGAWREQRRNRRAMAQAEGD